MSGSQQLLLGQTGGGGSSVTYVENVHSTYAYTGTGSTLPIVNNIDLSTKGGAVWYKSRATGDNVIVDTVRGFTYSSSPLLLTNSTNAQLAVGSNYLETNTTGYTIGPSATGTNINGSGTKYISWTFAEQTKFFDVVPLLNSTTTYNHNLGATPACILAKCTSAGSANWVVYHKNLPSPTTQYLNLNTAGTTGTYGAGAWAVSSTQFTIDSGLWSTGTNGIAYLFPSAAGGFGEGGTDSVTFCGVFNSTGQVTCGFEPQWVLMKDTGNSSSYTGDWRLFDCIRGIYADIDDAQLFPNTNGPENSGSFGTVLAVNATGFVVEGQGYNGSPVVFVAIRRGPMAVPTVGTSVYSQVKYAGDNTSNRAFTTGFPVDTNLVKGLTGSGNSPCIGLRKTDGMGETEITSNPYQSLTDWIAYDDNTQLIYQGSYQYSNASGIDYLSNSFLRAPKFHDVQTWNGTGASRSVDHTLTIPPELIIIKNRAVNSSWPVYCAALGNTKALELNTNGTAFTYNYWQNTTPTSTQFFVTSATEINGSGNPMQAIMFATCPGVSKVGSYTGTGGAQTIDCGFSTGARLVIIKRTDVTGGWYVFSSAMGMSPGTSPYYLLNSNAAYVTGVDYVNKTNVGFTLTSSALSELNGSGGTFIFVAIA